MAPNSHHKENFAKPNLDFVSRSPKPESTQIKCQSRSTLNESNKTNLEANKTNLEPNKTKLEFDKNKLEPSKTKLKPDKSKLESNKTALESIALKLQCDKSKLKSGISRLNSVDTNLKESMCTKLEPVKAKLESIVLKLESMQTEMESDKPKPEYVNVQPESGKTEQDLSKTKLEPSKTKVEPPQMKPDPGKSEASEADLPEVPGICSLITLWIEVHDAKVKLLEQWETNPMEVVMEHKTELKVWVEFGRWIRKNYIDQFLVEDIQRLQMVYDDWRQAPRTPWNEWSKTSRSLLRQFKHDSSCSNSSRCAYVCPSTKKDSLMI